jgi:hypothetical protein
MSNRPLLANLSASQPDVALDATVSVPGHEGGIRPIGVGSQDWRLVRQERPELLHSLLERRISSLKVALYRFGAKPGGEELVAEGAVERLDIGRPERHEPIPPEHGGPPSCAPDA